jgi:hypothetical protein
MASTDAVASTSSTNHRNAMDVLIERLTNKALPSYMSRNSVPVVATVATPRPVMATVVPKRRSRPAANRAAVPDPNSESISRQEMEEIDEIIQTSVTLDNSKNNEWDGDCDEDSDYNPDDNDDGDGKYDSDPNEDTESDNDQSEMSEEELRHSPTFD